VIGDCLLDGKGDITHPITSSMSGGRTPDGQLTYTEMP